MSTTGHENEAINVSGLKASLKKGGNIGIYNEATCSTAGGTAAKVTNTTPPSFTLTAGAKILVKFTYAISAENATLQVGSNTSKPIYYKGAALPADIVKAGTSVLLQYDGTSFNIIGDLNTDTTYSEATTSASGLMSAADKEKLNGIGTMGASGSTHASGLVPDTPSTAGTTKFLREDGTWQEPAGQNYSAGDGIDISNNEISADNTIARKTDLAPAKLGSGIGTCSTSSGTALEVVLSDYNLVQNGIVAVTFENDVPANATLNINGKGAKPIIYKGSAITADTIKADDTVTFGYDGTNYVVTSLGGGGGSSVYPEFVTIQLTQSGGSDSALIGATVVVTNDDTSAVILSTTWQGGSIVAIIDNGINYTVTVGDVESLSIGSHSQSYTAVSGTIKVITFTYLGYIVDLGLPSGTKWAKGNIVSNGNGGYKIGDETDNGAYFSWGNVTPHFSSNGSTFDDGYNWGTDNTGPYASTPGAAISGSPTTGAAYAANSGYDAARQLLGEKWRVPTAVELQELNDNCTSVWTTKNGVAGREFTSNINGNKIFFPAAGYGYGAQLYQYNVHGDYYSSSLYSADKGHRMWFTNSNVYPQNNDFRYYGYTLRPVQ